MGYDRNVYLKYKDKLFKDPIRLEKVRSQARERSRKRLQNPKYVKYNRKKSNDYYHDNKLDPDFRSKNLKRFSEYRQRNRRIVIWHYSGGTMKCICCGEPIFLFLEIDHMNGEGNKHRKSIGIGNRFTDWLLRNNLPVGFRVMCCNCNKGRYLNGGKCPHEET